MKYSVYLDDKGQNLITKRNVPWLDIGDLPETYDYKKTEAFQVFMVPKEKPGDTMIIEYNTWLGQYDLLHAQLVFD